MKKRGFLDGYKTYSGPRGDPSEWQAAMSDRLEPEGADSPEKVLGVSPGASWVEIRSAYRVLASRYHPDHAVHNGMTVSEATEHFKRILTAYTALEKKNKSKKKKGKPSKPTQKPETGARMSGLLFDDEEMS